jgi:hypothetical protein
VKIFTARRGRRGEKGKRGKVKTLFFLFSPSPLPSHILFP